MNGFRKNTDEDVTVEKYKLYLLPHSIRVEKYLMEYVIPDVCAFYIASGYDTGGLELNSLNIYINDVMALFNNNYKPTNSLKAKVIKCLKIKYNLDVVCEKPLTFRQE